jgi:3-phenylpropionate/cinnamic acid dioxygenase small subunit
MTPGAPVGRLQEFIYDEARLIDDKRFDEWYELFTDDALYWMPLARGQMRDDLHNSLLYEDKLLLKVRIERLKRPGAFSQQLPSFCQHVLQLPRLESSSEGERRHLMRTPFVYFESRGEEQICLAGVYYHDLIEDGGHLRIKMKQIELLNRDAALPSIQMFL